MTSSNENETTDRVRWLARETAREGTSETYPDSRKSSPTRLYLHRLVTLVVDKHSKFLIILAGGRATRKRFVREAAAASPPTYSAAPAETGEAAGGERRTAALSAPSLLSWTQAVPINPSHTRTQSASEGPFAAAAPSTIKPTCSPRRSLYGPVRCPALPCSALLCPALPAPLPSAQLAPAQIINDSVRWRWWAVCSVRVERAAGGRASSSSGSSSASAPR